MRPGATGPVLKKTAVMVMGRFFPGFGLGIGSPGPTVSPKHHGLAVAVPATAGEGAARRISL